MTYHDNGYEIVRDVLDKITMQCLEIIGSGRVPCIFDKDYRPVMQPHREYETFHHAMTEPSIVTVMECLLGGRVSAIQSQYFYCPPGTKGYLPHQDNFYVEAPHDQFASVWIPFQDTSRANGGMMVWPGTHKLPILPIESVNEQGEGLDPNARAQLCVVPAGFEPIDVEVPAGAGLFMHGHTVHASHDNTSSEWRRALLLTYVREGASFRAGTRAKRESVNVYGEVSV